MRSGSSAFEMRSRQVGVEFDAVAAQDVVGRGAAVVVEHDVGAGLGDALAEHRLRRRHELDPLLDRAAAAQEQVLLHGVLGVVARVHLVGGEVDEVEARRRHVDVHDDAASQVAEVVVEGPPRLVRHRLERERLAVGEVDERRSALAQHREQLLEHGHGDTAVDEVLRAPALPALVERAVARQQLVELGMDSLVHALGRQPGRTP